MTGLRALIICTAATAMLLCVCIAITPRSVLWRGDVFYFYTEEGALLAAVSVSCDGSQHVGKTQPSDWLISVDRVEMTLAIKYLLSNPARWWRMTWLRLSSDGVVVASANNGKRVEMFFDINADGMVTGDIYVRQDGGLPRSRVFVRTTPYVENERGMNVDTRSPG